ncbi:hypothetical protein CN571_02295 [Bacillus pseudomycoides]|nr:hypothetical protein CN559_21835 [Bacillus pseudomycoides]PEO92635.1 hypothetical protein CN571_02295 [Bacillus pseudomycoides]PHC39679.1 hypothetical protein COF01_08210 [Bacillus pseudomycoides]
MIHQFTSFIFNILIIKNILYKMFLYVKVLGRGGSIVINSKYYKVMFFIRMEGVYVIVDICIYLIIRSIDKMGNNRMRGREK